MTKILFVLFLATSLPAIAAERAIDESTAGICSVMNVPPFASTKSSHICLHGSVIFGSACCRACRVETGSCILDPVVGRVGAVEPAHDLGGHGMVHRHVALA